MDCLFISLPNVDKILKRLNMDNAHPLSTPMIFQSFYPKKIALHHKEDYQRDNWPKSTISKSNNAFHI